MSGNPDENGGALSAALSRLALAVADLETVAPGGGALLAPEAEADGDAAFLRAEVRSLRALQDEVAGRLDGAIARLRATIGE